MRCLRRDWGSSGQGEGGGGGGTLSMVGVSYVVFALCFQSPKAFYVCSFCSLWEGGGPSCCFPFTAAGVLLLKCRVLRVNPVCGDNRLFTPLDVIKKVCPRWGALRPSL